MKPSTHRTSAGAVLAVLLVILSTTPVHAATFGREKTQTADGSSFLFPDDALRTGPAVFALSMAQDRENGSEQQKELMEWQKHFNEHPDVLGAVPVYHFPVLAGVPFFAKGPIRNALAKYYAEAVTPDRVGVLFISDIEEFTSQAGIPLDKRSTLVVVASNGAIKGYVKGALTPAKVQRLQALIR